VTISGGRSVGVFTVNSDATFSVKSLTIANGSAETGAGINNAGTLNVANSTFTGNSTSTGVRHGGVINNDHGSVSVSNSTFSGNHGGTGGSIYNGFGTLNVSNSTFSGNSATQDGGAIGQDWGTTTLADVILAHNSATFDGDCYNFHGLGTVVDAGGNIDAGTTCGFTLAAANPAPTHYSGHWPTTAPSPRPWPC